MSLRGCAAANAPHPQMTDSSSVHAGCRRAAAATLQPLPGARRLQRHVRLLLFWLRLAWLMRHGCFPLRVYCSVKSAPCTGVMHRAKH